MVAFLGLKNPSSPYDAFFLGHGVIILFHVILLFHVSCIVSFLFRNYCCNKNIHY